MKLILVALIVLVVLISGCATQVGEKPSPRPASPEKTPAASEALKPSPEIQGIISSDAFDKIEALQSHKVILEKDLDRSKKMIRTINKTISHLRGKEKMKDEELYYGFDSEKQKKYEKQLIAEGVVTQEYLDEYKKKLTSNDKDKFIEEGKKINDDLISLTLRSAV